MHFDLIDLRLFLHTLDTGNMTAGAQRSHLSLAAASARIRAMEASLGIALLDRNRRGVQPTAAGQALGEHSRRVLQQIEHLQFDLAQYAQGIQGQVRLLCNTAALTEYLPELLGDFLQRHPGVDLDVEEMPSLRILQALRQGAAPLGIISSAVAADGLQTRAFRDDPLMLIMPVDHPLARQPSVSFVDSLAYGHVGLAVNNALGILVEEQALRSGRRMQVRVRAEGFDGAVRMVARGAGVAVVPLAAVRRCQGQLHFVTRALQEPWAARRLLLCSADFSALPGHAQALLASLAPDQLSLDAMP